MATRETIERYLAEKMKTGEISRFAELFTNFIFVGGSALPNYELLGHLKYLFEIAVRKCRDDLALDVLKKIQYTYRAIEEETEKKKESQRQYFGNAAKKADDIFFEFVALVYSTIIWKSKDRLAEKSETIMQKTRFWILEYASKRWVQEMTDESYDAFRFLIKALSQEKKEILDKILRPRVETWFTKVELIEKWLMDRREPVPYEVQQLLAMARAKNGGPELAKKDITNAMAVNKGK